MAIAVSLVILLGWQFFVEGPRREAQLMEEKKKSELAELQRGKNKSNTSLPAISSENLLINAEKPRNEIVKETRRIKLKSESLIGSINLENGRIDDITMLNYRENIDPTSDNVVLLSPKGSPNPYFAEFGWASREGTFGASGAKWKSSKDTLTPESPIVLTSETKEGLKLKRTYSIDNKFMITVADRIENNGSNAISLSAFARLSRVNTPDTLGFFILHEGPIGVIDDTLKEIDYDDLEDDFDENNGRPKPTTFPTTGGWLGITDKYWLAALIPNQSKAVNTSFSYQKTAKGADSYQTDIIEQQVHVLNPGDYAEATNRLFAGAKVFETLSKLSLIHI